MTIRPEERASAARRVLLHVAIGATLLVVAGGCSWFRGGQEDGPQPIAATTNAAAVQSDARPSFPDDRTDLTARNSAQRQNQREAYESRPVSSRAPLVLAPQTAPAATRPAVTMPEYLVLGSVVANVNGTPIYGHELVKRVAPALKARARDLDERQFRQLAQSEVRKQRDVMIADELEYAAALRNTTSEDQQDAKARTFVYRERLISRAGGSEQVARARLAEQGEDLNEVLRNEERRNLVRLYYSKKVLPRITVTVDEMRRFYEQNRASRFTVPAQATIRLIRIDPREVGDETAAAERAAEVQRRAASGENFDVLSDEYNKMPFLRDAKGKVGPISKGAYAIKEVDTAIWQTPAGQVSPVLKAADGTRYVVKIEQRNDGRVMDFSEQEVQDQINAALREQRLGELRQRRQEELRRDATVQDDPAMLQPVLEMAMQMYPTWHAGR